MNRATAQSGKPRGMMESVDRQRDSVSALLPEQVGKALNGVDLLVTAHNNYHCGRILLDDGGHHFVGHQRVPRIHDLYPGITQDVCQPLNSLGAHRALQAGYHHSSRSRHSTSF